jgi:hypothetical protein
VKKLRFFGSMDKKYKTAKKKLGSFAKIFSMKLLGSKKV